MGFARCKKLKFNALHSIWKPSREVPHLASHRWTRYHDRSEGAWGPFWGNISLSWKLTKSCLVATTSQEESPPCLSAHHEGGRQMDFTSCPPLPWGLSHLRSQPRVSTPLFRLSTWKSQALGLKWSPLVHQVKRTPRQTQLQHTLLTSLGFFFP